MVFESDVEVDSTGKSSGVLHHRSKRQRHVTVQNGYIAMPRYLSE